MNPSSNDDPVPQRWDNCYDPRTVQPTVLLLLSSTEGFLDALILLCKAYWSWASSDSSSGSGCCSWSPSSSLVYTDGSFPAPAFLLSQYPLWNVRRFTHLINNLVSDTHLQREDTVAAKYAKLVKLDHKSSFPLEIASGLKCVMKINISAY